VEKNIWYNESRDMILLPPHRFHFATTTDFIPTITVISAPWSFVNIRGNF